MPVMGEWGFCFLLLQSVLTEWRGELVKAVKRYEQTLKTVLCIFMVFYPFIMGFHVEELSGIAETYFAKSSGYMTDIFQFYKEIVLIIFAVIFLALLILGGVLSCILEERWPGRYKVEKPVMFLMGISLLLHIVSCVLSEYPEYSVLGLCLDYEGMAAITGYFILFIGGYILLGDENSVIMVLISIRALSVLIIIGACIECAAGPLFNMSGVAKALTPDSYEHLLENIYLDYDGSLSLTFANPGYFGGFCAMLFPILFGMAAGGSRRRICAFDSVMAGGLFFCIIMSGSSGALYAALIAVAAESIFMIHQGRWKRSIIAILSVGVIASAFFLFAKSTPIMDDSLVSERIGNSVVNSQYDSDGIGFHVETISLEDGELTIDSGENILRVKADGNGTETTIDDINFMDSNGEEIGRTQTFEGIRLSGAYSGVTASFHDQVLSIDLGYQDPLEFYCYKGKLSYIDFNGSLLESIPQPQVKGLEFLYPLFTGRGYIWVSSLPLLQECAVLGKGVGTFPFYYPQSEVAGMLNVHGSADYCIEIAHSWYLQTAVNGGCIALLCMAALFILHLVRGGKKYWRKAEHDTGILASHVAGALFFGLIAYEIAGIVNNSCVTTAPVFWLLFGCSLGLLRKKRIHTPR